MCHCTMVLVVPYTHDAGDPSVGSWLMDVFFQVLAHLARCLSQDASPRAFLEPFLVEGPVLAAEQESRPMQRWSLISDELLARPLAENIEFQLRQGDLFNLPLDIYI